MLGIWVGQIWTVVILFIECEFITIMHGSKFCLSDHWFSPLSYGRLHGNVWGDTVNSFQFRQSCFCSYRSVIGVANEVVGCIRTSTFVINLPSYDLIICLNYHCACEFLVCDNYRLSQLKFAIWILNQLFWDLAC